jgi:AbiV family abortive infection protein
MRISFGLLVVALSAIGAFAPSGESGLAGVGESAAATGQAELGNSYPVTKAIEMKTPSMPSSKLSAEEMWASRTAIFKSAERLFLDAKLLLENDRCASAYSLAVLALEEIGKLLLDIWDASSKSPKKKAPSNLHRSKQSAVASLLLADYLVKTHGRRIMIEGVTEELVELRDFSDWGP